MRHLATIQKIADVQPIDGADAIEKIKINEWWCVAKKGEFQVGDTCVYFEIDSLLPVDNPVFSFLDKGSKPKTVSIDGIIYTGYRLKTIRLRGQISQGLALPLEVIFHSKAHFYENFDVGHDVSDNLEIVKYEAPIPANLVGKIKGSFPGYLPKTDEERIQNIPELIEKYNYKNSSVKFYITEKLDGTSATFFRHTTIKDGDYFGVCSRNLELLETEGNTHWEIAHKYDLMNKIPQGICLQGEIVGDGIQQNPLKIQGREFYVYNAYDINAAKYLDYADLKMLVERLELKMVPVIFDSYSIQASIPEMLNAANGVSALNSNVPREGFVFRPINEMRDVIQGQDARLSFKVISNDYLLGEK